MSRYGAPGEPPWPGPGPEEYGPPADPWEPQPTESWGEPTAPPYPGLRPGYAPPESYDRTQSYRPESHGTQSYRPEGYGTESYGPAGRPPPWQALPPPGAGPPRRPLGLYALVTVLVVLAATGVGYALFLLSGDDEPVAGPTGAVPSSQASPAAGPEATRDNLGMNAAMALVQDCLVNDGSAAEPQMRIVACDSDEGDLPVFQVLEIFNERVEGEGGVANERAQEICADTEGYTHHYYEVGETASFVLCMAERE